MFGIERLQAIRMLVKEKKSVEVAHLSKELNVSEVTIRRDLDKLEKEGLVEKTYGGAVLIREEKDVYCDIELPSRREEEIKKNKYDQLAVMAAKIIEPKDTVFIGGGEMGIALVKALVHRESMIIVTNNIDVAMVIYKETKHRLIMLGGEVEKTTGNVTETEQLGELFIEKAFLTVEGVDIQKGYTVNEKQEVYYYRKLSKMTRDIILLVPRERYRCRGLIKMAALSEILTVVTDKNIPEEFKGYYFENNIKVHTSMLGES